MTPAQIPPATVASVRYMLMLLGCANLVPWTTFLALSDYFYERYGNNSMEFLFPTVSTTSLVVCSMLMLLIGSRLSFHVRIGVPSLLMCLLLLVVPLVDVLIAGGIIAADTGFKLTLVSVLFNALCSASAQNSLYALASLLGDTATQALQMGNGMSGLISVGLRMALKLGLPSTPAMWSFCLSGALILLFSVLSYLALMSDPTVKMRIDAHEHRRKMRHGPGSQSLDQPMLDPSYEEGEGQWGSGDYARFSPPRSNAARAPSTFNALSLACVESASVFLIFVVCLASFPGLTTSVVSTSWNLGDWFPIVLVSAFSVADFVGKTLPGYVRVISSRTLPWWALAHTLFVPAFVTLARPDWLPPALHDDAFTVALVLALGLCTGYIGCMALILGSEHGCTAEEREVLGMLTSFCLMMGLSTGSFVGLLLSHYILDMEIVLP